MLANVVAEAPEAPAAAEECCCDVEEPVGCIDELAACDDDDDDDVAAASAAAFLSRSRSRSLWGRNASRKDSTRFSLGPQRECPALFCNQTTCVPCMHFTLTSVLKKNKNLKKVFAIRAFFS